MSPPQGTGRTERLRALGEGAQADLAAVAEAREQGLVACRATIQACGKAIRVVHRYQPAAYEELVERAEGELRAS